MVGYSEYSHLKRFEEMLKLGDFIDKSLLDVGCGPAAFYKFLKSKQIFPEYHGIDISQEMIQVAKELNSDISENFLLHDIVKEDIHKTYDYLICIGILNLDFGGTTNIEMTKVLIQQLFKHAKIGFAISMTSNLSNKPTSGTYYYDSSEIIKFVSELTNNFILSHSYLANDFTLFCYKHQN